MIDCYMVDIHVANRCNLNCDGCNHWSNYGFKEVFSAKTLYEWAEPWSKILNPERINLLGGEPLLNKESPQIIEDYRRLFPNSSLKFFTNAFTLSKQDWLEDSLRKNDGILVITLHSSEKSYLKKFKSELQCLNNWGIPTLKKKTWFRTVFDYDGLEVEIRDMRGHWYKTYTGNGYNAKPYKDEKPRESWENCVSKRSVQLYHGKLHKCGAITYLNDFLGKYNLLEDEDWKPYSEYVGISPTDSKKKIEQFFKTEEEWICGMCPSNPDKKQSKEVFKRYEY